MTVTALFPDGDIGAGTRRTDVRSTVLGSGSGTSRYRGRKTSTGVSIGAPRTTPSARARASTTSARPPVFAHGSHSDAIIATRIAIDRIVRATRTSPSVSQQSPASDEQFRRSAMDPVRVPSIPAASFMLPPRLEGLRRLAYKLHWAWHPHTRGLIDPFHAMDCA